METISTRDTFSVLNSDGSRPGVGDGGDDTIKSGKGDDVNCGDGFTGNAEGNGFICFTGGNGGDDKINAGQGDDILTGDSGADKFNCGKGTDTVTDFNKAEGDKATGNCEGVQKAKSKTK